MGEVKSMIADTGKVIARKNVRRNLAMARSKTTCIQRLRYRAIWRSKQLIILPLDCHTFRQSVSAVLEGDRNRILACLKHSNIQRLILSPELPTAEQLFWADLGKDSALPVYIRKRHIRTRKTGFASRMLNVLGAGVALLLMSPLMLLIALSLALSTGKVISRDWRIGEHGRFFQAFQFVYEVDRMPGWLTNMRRSEWSQLPGLFNVIRGDVGLFKSRSIHQLSPYLWQNRIDLDWDK